MSAVLEQAADTRQMTAIIMMDILDHIFVAAAMYTGNTGIIIALADLAHTVPAITS